MCYLNIYVIGLRGGRLTALECDCIKILNKKSTQQRNRRSKYVRNVNWHREIVALHWTFIDLITKCIFCHFK